MSDDRRSKHASHDDIDEFQLCKTDINSKEGERSSIRLNLNHNRDTPVHSSISKSDHSVSDSVQLENCTIPDLTTPCIDARVASENLTSSLDSLQVPVQSPQPPKKAVRWHPNVKHKKGVNSDGNSDTCGQI